MAMRRGNRRVPSTFSERRSRPSFLRTTPAKKPRTECCCQWVARMMAAIVTTQHGEHASLFRPWPAFARGASFGLRLARLMPRANGLMRCNGSPLARGDDFDGRCFDFGAVGSRANACLHRRAHRIILDSDCLEALLGDAKRHGSSFSIASPGQQRAIGADLFKQPSADEPIDGLSNRFARNVCRQVNSAI